MMPMIFCIRMEPISGLKEKELIIRTPMERDVPYPAPLRLILRKDIAWKNP